MRAIAQPRSGKRIKQACFSIRAFARACDAQPRGLSSTSPASVAEVARRSSPALDAKGRIARRTRPIAPKVRKLFSLPNAPSRSGMHSRWWCRRWWRKLRCMPGEDARGLDGTLADSGQASGADAVRGTRAWRRTRRVRRGWITGRLPRSGRRSRPDRAGR